MKPFIILLVVSLNLFAQYSLPSNNTLPPNHILNLSHAIITIPNLTTINEFNDSGICYITMNHDAKLRKITSRFISDPSYLSRQMFNCFGDKLAPRKPGEVVTSNGWSINFQFGFTRTNYINTDINVDGAELQGTIHNFNFNERTSHDYYNPGNWDKFENAFKWIDEPTNHMILSFEKNGNNLIISAFHPKWIIGNNDYNRVVGNLNGKEVDQYMDLDEPFEEDYSNYTTQPGELRLVVFENTHLQMEFAIGYGRDFTLFSTKKLGALKLQPAFYLGFMMGASKIATRTHDNFWEFNGYKAPVQIQGPMFGVGAKIGWDFGVFDVFYQFKYTRALINERSAWDGNINYIHQYTTNSFGLGIDIFNSRNRRTKPMPF